MHPTFALPPSFLGGCLSGPPDAAFQIAGIPFDLGTTNRAGARDAPYAVRRASRMLADGANPCGWADPAALSVVDRGDFELALGDIKQSLELIERQAAGIGHLLAIGGDHTITLALLRALVRRTGPVGLIHFDAHLDTWPDNFGQPLAHGSPFRWALEEGLLDGSRVIQVGIRSPVPRDVHEWTLAQGVTIVTAEEVHLLGPEAVSQRIRSVVGEGRTYLSFDIDAIDPGQAPGTGTPEVGGLTPRESQRLLRGLAGINIVGGDVVEVAPQYDATTVTAQIGAQMMFEILALLALAPK